jgi:hypothetical protein
MKRKVSWEEVIDLGKKENKVIVSGCQRSGTTIAALAIATEINRTFIDESAYMAENQKLFHHEFTIQNKFVMHAPAMLHILPHYQDKALIVIIERDIQDVVKSMKRIGWFERHGKYEYRKFKKEIPSSPEEIYKVKEEFIVSLNCIILPYTELKKSSLYVDKRENWYIKQTAPSNKN